eukprot:5990331-Prorocentrum_lima.AAC.1
MTSSLVGSEMCIRDSSRPFWHPLAPRPQTGRQQLHSCAAWVGARMHWPVSYTHLTLPTICSV